MVNGDDVVLQGHLEIFHQDSALLLGDVLSDVDDNAAIASISGEVHPDTLHKVGDAMQKQQQKKEEHILTLCLAKAHFHFHFLPPVTLTNPSAGQRLSSGFCRSVTFGRSESIRGPPPPSESQRAPAPAHLELEYFSQTFHGNSTDKTQIGGRTGK